MTEYNHVTGKDGRFVDYINTFLNWNRRLAVIPAGPTVPKTRSDMTNRFGRMKGYS